MSGRWWEALLLLLLSGMVAGPVSARFARAGWAAREPVAALLAWQGIGLCGGFALLTAELTVASAGEPGPWRSAVASALRHPGSLTLVGSFGLALFALSVVWLISVLVFSFAGAARVRGRHRQVLDILSTDVERTSSPRVSVVEAPVPLAYSLSGRSPRVVLSSTTLSVLSPSQLRAVLAHERAHLTQRHDILVQPFIAWHRSLPFLPSTMAARERVEQLAEMVCDDVALRQVACRDLASALDEFATDAVQTRERVMRLSDRRASARLSAALVAVAAVLVCLPPALLIAVGV